VGFGWLRTDVDRWSDTWCNLFALFFIGNNYLQFAGSHAADSLPDFSLAHIFLYLANLSVSNLTAMCED
jgi:hypothetical protein